MQQKARAVESFPGDTVGMSFKVHFHYFNCHCKNFPFRTDYVLREIRT